MANRKLIMKTIAGISAAAMAFSLVSYAPLDWGSEVPYAYQAYALTAPDDYITDSNGLMAYMFKNRNYQNDSVDFRGVFNDEWKKVTYNNAGFRTFLRVGNTTYYPNLLTGEISDYSDISVKFEPEFVNGGKLIKLVYNVTNNSDAAVTFDLAIGADVQIGSDDYAPIIKLDKTKDGKDTGFLMTSTSAYDKDGNGNFAGFGLIMNGAKGANASDFWYGHYRSVDENMFSTVPADDLTGTDSGATVSWKNCTVGAGQTVSLSAYIGIGSAEELKAIIKEMLNAATDYVNEQITDLEPDSKYELTITEPDGSKSVHPITSSDVGTIPMEGTDDNGDHYSMIGKTSSLVKKGNGDDTEDSDPVQIEVGGRPSAPSDPNAPTGTPADIITPSDIESTGDSITIKSKPDTEYTIDGGKTWIQPDENGNVTFDGLTEGEEIIIQTRTSATDKSPASPISDGVKITVAKTIPDDELNIKADDLVFNGEPQSAGITCDDPDVTITYSTSLDGEFTSNIPEFTDDGVYTVYYCASKSGCVPKYGSYKVTVVKTYEFDSEEHWKIVDGEKVSVGAHTYGDWKTVTEPGCTTEGTEKHFCTVCGYSEARSLPAAGHNIPDEWKSTEAVHYHQCTVCDEKFDEALHTYGDWKIVVPASADNNGEKMRACTVCGYEQTAPVNYIPNEDGTDPDLGKINNTTDAETNACHGDVALTRAEIVEKFGLTNEEQAAVENGVDVNVYLVVKDITENVPAEDKALAEKIVSDNENVAMYLDISLFKQVTGFAPTQVANTNGNVKITFTLPESLVNNDSNISRKFFIVRVHDGKAEKLACDYNAETGICSFETDKFSSYAIAYADTVLNAKPASYPISIRGNVTADRSSAVPGDIVNVSTSFGYDIIVRDTSGKIIAKITEKGSFTMPDSRIFITVVRNESLSLMENGWRHSYVYAYDDDMNVIKVSSDIKRGVVIIDLGADNAGKEFSLYNGKKSTSKLVTTGVLDSSGRYVLNTADGKKYTLIIK